MNGLKHVWQVNAQKDSAVLVSAENGTMAKLNDIWANGSSRLYKPGMTSNNGVIFGENKPQRELFTGLFFLVGIYFSKS